MSTTRLSLRGLLLVGVALVAGTAPMLLAPAMAQAQQATQAAGLNSLPPALRAAVTSGNGSVVTQVINTLSGGSPQRAAQLADQVIRVAEQMLSTNPQAAIAVAGAAVETVRNAPVQTSSPQQTQSVVTIAARIFVSPPAIQVAPIQAAALATNTLQVAITTNNSVLVASVAQSAVSTAEQIVQNDPAAAVQLASQSVQAVGQTQVTQAAPQQTMDVATAAARIIVQPAVQQASPQTVASVAIAVTQAVTNPAVYQSSPQAAVAAMSSAYSAASSQSVVTAAPQTVSTVTANLNQASNNTALSQSNPTNAAQVNAILARPAATQEQQQGTGTQTAQQNTQQQNTANTNNNTNNNTPPPVVTEENPILTGSPT